MSRSVEPQRFVWTLIALGFLSTGCFRVPQQSATLATVKDVAVSSTLLQLRAYETGRLVSSIIEAAADSIALVSRDPVVRVRSVQWKSAAIPLVQEASLHDEPLVAVVDLWAFALQQADYFETGDGRSAFGASQQVAVTAARQIVAETRRTFGRTLRSGEIPSEAVEAVPTWASTHPIRGAEMHRESLLSSDWQLLGIEESSLSGSVVSLNRTLLGITQRMGYLNQSMLKQVRWQGERVATAVFLDPRTESLVTSLQSTSAAIETALRDAPADLQHVRQLVSGDLREQQVAAFAALDRQREATLTALAEERRALFAALRTERIATLAAVDSVTQGAIDHLITAVTPLIQTFLAVFSLGVVVLIGARYLRGAREAAPLRHPEQEGTV